MNSLRALLVMAVLSYGAMLLAWFSIEITVRIG